MFLIRQGEVEQIAMMKSKAQNKNEDGMLEFLEDIVGSSRFKRPIEILAKRVEELAELKTEKVFFLLNFCVILVCDYLHLIIQNIFKDISF